jgi:hypothetical protein
MSAHGDEPRHPGPGTLRWRERTLVSAGFDGELAARIARDGDVDLHALLELVDRGCPPHLAFRILAPLGTALP